jgi:hypothetical protein
VDTQNWNNSQHYLYAWENPDGNADAVLPHVNVAAKTYPNPFNNKLTVQISSAAKAPVKVEMFNLKGQKVLSSSAMPNSSMDLEQSNLANGIYFLKVSQGNSSVTRKVMKLK